MEFLVHQWCNLASALQHETRRSPHSCAPLHRIPGKSHAESLDQDHRTADRAARAYRLRSGGRPSCSGTKLCILTRGLRERAAVGWRQRRPTPVSFHFYLSLHHPFKQIGAIRL
ncbi:MAG: hypothetical protein ACRDFB_10120 [Rhabdochlamydiaceae bacterium]